MPEPIRKSSLPCTPPPEWEFSTVLSQPSGCLLVPDAQYAGFPVVRRRVSWGDWEPVTPDHWADEEPTDAKAGPTPAGTVDNPADRRGRYEDAMVGCATLTDHANVAMAVADTEMQQLREMYSQQSAANAAYRLQIDDLIRRNSEYADRAIANGERALAAEAALARVRDAATLHRQGLLRLSELYAVIEAALDQPQEKP